MQQRKCHHYYNQDEIHFKLANWTYVFHKYSTFFIISSLIYVFDLLFVCMYEINTPSPYYTDQHRKKIQIRNPKINPFLMLIVRHLFGGIPGFLKIWVSCKDSWIVEYFCRGKPPTNQTKSLLLPLFIMFPCNKQYKKPNDKSSLRVNSYGSCMNKFKLHIKTFSSIITLRVNPHTPRKMQEKHGK